MHDSLQEFKMSRKESRRGHGRGGVVFGAVRPGRVQYSRCQTWQTTRPSRHEELFTGLGRRGSKESHEGGSKVGVSEA